MNKTKYLAGKLGIALCGSLLAFASHGQPSISVGVSVPTPSVGVVIHAESDFYEPLGPQGEWVVVGSYGRCWRPSHVARDWRPYCNGNWELTDAGWYWVSDEPWAWATYHYGRWDFTDQYGWYWVPQIQWAPAWVSWHEGGGYVGWAPLQPSVSISVNGYVGFNQSHIPSRAFVFVDQRHFMEPIRPTTVVANNTTVINKTTVNITNTRIVNNAVINGGPTTTVVEKASGRKVQVVPVQELRARQEVTVVSQQRAPASTSEKKVQTPPRAEVKSQETKPGVAHQTPVIKRPVESPAARPPENEKVKSILRTESSHTAVINEPTIQKNHEAQVERQKPVVAAAEHKPLVKPESRVASSHPVATKLATEPKGDKSVPHRTVREGPTASEKNDSHPQDKNEEKKIKD